MNANHLDRGVEAVGIFTLISVVKFRFDRRNMSSSILERSIGTSVVCS